MTSLAALLLCALAGGDKVELRFAPVEGSQVRRTIAIDQTLAAKGSEPLTTRKFLRTLDQYRKLGDGRPLVLQRRFEQIGGSSAGVSPLQGTSVVYTWVPEEAAYGKYYDALESSEAALRDLAEDLDLRALLPRGAVATGESWSVPAAQLRDVLAPLGFLGVTDYLGELQGECKLALAAVGERQGRSIATVELALKIQNATWTFEGRGTLDWDLGARRAASFALSGDQTQHFEPQAAPLAGTLAYTWKFEDPGSK